jgi:hypothetical protein
LVNQSHVTAKEADTLELLAAVALGQPVESMDRFAVNFGANDGKLMPFFLPIAFQLL